MQTIPVQPIVRTFGISGVPQETSAGGTGAKSAPALKDFLDAVQNVDNNHQEQLFMVCFGEIAKRNQWS